METKSGGIPGLCGDEKTRSSYRLWLWLSLIISYFSGTWGQTPVGKDWDRGMQLSLLTHSPFSSTILADMGLWLVLTKEPPPCELLALWLPPNHRILSASWLKVWEDIVLDMLVCQGTSFRSGTHLAQFCGVKGEESGKSDRTAPTSHVVKGIWVGKFQRRGSWAQRLCPVLNLLALKLLLYMCCTPLPCNTLENRSSNSFVCTMISLCAFCIWESSQSICWMSAHLSILTPSYFYIHSLFFRPLFLREQHSG